MNRWLFAMLLALVVLAPLPLGSNREWSWTLCALGVGALLCLQGAGQWLLWLRTGHPSGPPGAQSAAGIPLVPLLLFIGVCAWIFLQTLPGVPPRWAHPMWPMAAAALAEPLPATITLSPTDTLTALMRLVTYAGVFGLAYQLGQDRGRALLALRVLAWAGMAWAMLGLVLYGSGQALPWFPERDTSRVLQGPFVNRNHFATWLGLALLCALGLLYARLGVRRNPAYQLPKGRAAQVEQFIVEAWRPLAGVLLILSALVLTQSRAGFAATLGGAVVLTWALRRGSRRSNWRSSASLGAAIAVCVLAFTLTGRLLIERMDRLPDGAPGRFDTYALTTDALGDNPLLGYGYGTYANSFRLYRDDRITGWYDRAHNTYLENLFELGWPAAMALFASIGWCAWLCLRGLRRGRQDRTFPALGVAATALVGLHAGFDFSLQIPAVAMAFALVLGIACAQSRGGSTTASRRAA